MGVFRAFHLARAALRFGYAMCRNEVTGWTPWAIVAPVDPDPEQTRRGADPVLTDAWTMMESMLRFLTPRQSEVLRLCHFEGLSQAEVARRLKLTRATVWKHLKAAEATMREPWGDCEPFWL
jgi:DNA-directed RNA polymerase specialized sigma24 family protein